MSPTSYQTAPPRAVPATLLHGSRVPSGPAFPGSRNTVDIRIPVVFDRHVAATRLTRAEQVERNRERVVAAAREVFAESGYAKATLDAISERAGFSKGVVYSQFASKADLFLVLLERRIEERAAQNIEIAETVDPRDALAALVRVGDQDARDRQDWARVLVEFRAHASYD